MQPGRSGYVNADITLHLHRPPVGEWHFLRIVSRGANDGVRDGSGSARRPIWGIRGKFRSQFDQSLDQQLIFFVAYGLPDR